MVKNHLTTDNTDYAQIKICENLWWKKRKYLTTDDTDKHRLDFDNKIILWKN